MYAADILLCAKMPAPALICAQIQISIKLLEKLAGIKREEPQQQRRPQR
jgi:hypothetical protein